MAKRNRYTTYPRKSPLNAAQIAVILLALSSIFLAVIVLSNLDGNKIQEIEIYESNLNDVIPSLVVDVHDTIKDLPDGITEAARKNGKDEIKYGTILRGECNSYLSKEGGRLDYRKVHPNDIIWVEHLGKGHLRLWVFLEKGTIPDLNFFEIIKK